MCNVNQNFVSHSVRPLRINSGKSSQRASYFYYLSFLCSEISKNEDLLKEYQLYKKFLDSLTPPEWKEEQRAERNKKRKQNTNGQRIPSATSKKGNSNYITPKH